MFACWIAVRFFAILIILMFTMTCLHVLIQLNDSKHSKYTHASTGACDFFVSFRFLSWVFPNKLFTYWCCTSALSGCNFHCLASKLGAVSQIDSNMANIGCDLELIFLPRKRLYRVDFFFQCSIYRNVTSELNCCQCDDFMCVGSYLFVFSLSFGSEFFCSESQNLIASFGKCLSNDR